MLIRQNEPVRGAFAKLMGRLVIEKLCAGFEIFVLHKSHQVLPLQE